MTLTKNEIRQFAKSAVEFDPAVLTASTDERRAKLLAEVRRNATGYYEKAQDDVRQSGYRVTQRVKNIIWAALAEIEARAIAPSTVTRNDVSTIAMVAKNETRHARIVHDGQVLRWIGFGWVNEGAATNSEKRMLPLLVD